MSTSPPLRSIRLSKPKSMSLAPSLMSLQHCRERFSNPPNHPDRPVEDSQTHRSVSPTLHEDGTKVSCSVNVVGSQSRLEEGSALSCELVKLLNQIWLLEQQHKESTSMVSSLRGELKKTKASIKELQSEQSSYDEDMEMLDKKLADERTALHGRAEEAVLAAIKPFKEELEVERKSKLKLESKYKKLSKEVNEVKRGLTKTMQELEREQKARELMEDVCDELAREIGEDKAQVEELKRQSAKYREEVEQERRMLQMAEVWREERVHMKLAEAKFELEEKNAALDTLRSELEAFLKVKRSLEDGHKNDPSNYVNTEKEAQSFPLHSSVKHVLLGQQSSKDAIAVVSAFEDERRGGHVYENREVDGCFDVNSHSTKLNRVPYPEGLKVPTSIAPGNSDKNAQILFSGNITNEIEENDLHVPSKVHERWHDPSENAVNSGKGLIGHGQTDNLNRHLTQGKGSAPDVPFFDSYAGGIDAHTELSQHNSKIQNLDGLSDPKQTVPLPLSPTQERTHTWFSVDPYGPGKMNSSMENLKPYKDTSLRARLQEAKLENQQARLKDVYSSAAVEY
ncbi:hypothetical protein KP509_09G041900 [Ceratopteris richardii]|uniref:Uncharacterized protein n=1 Tax=Ceratopteris richardii TaxID=49495 RepID=A0A8T2U3Q6_CERRI|nr:hypothetical protein KP509_09G041900 [Ceratopteris richardii]